MYLVLAMNNAVFTQDMVADSDKWYSSVLLMPVMTNRLLKKVLSELSHTM